MVWVPLTALVILIVNMLLVIREADLRSRK
jgi:hypothetical protein